MKKLYFLIFIFSFFLALNVRAESATDLTDDFDSYNLGVDLSDQSYWQGSWVIPSDTSPAQPVVNTYFVNSPNSLACLTGVSSNCLLGHEFTDTGIGTISFWSKAVYQSGIILNSHFSDFNFRGSSGSTAVNFRFRANSASTTFDLVDQNESIIFQDLSFDEWHYYQMDFSSTTDKFRLSVDFGTPSSWISSTAGFNYLDFMSISISGTHDHISVFYDDFKMTTGENYFASLSITDPVNTEYVQASDTYSITGTCPTVGADRLYLTNHFYTAIPLSYFTIDCQTNYTWNFVYPVLTGNHEIWIFDKDYTRIEPQIDIATSTASSVYTGYDPADQQYFLNIISPPDDGSHVFNIQYSDDFPFQFGWQIPDTYLATTTLFTLKSYTDQTYTVVDQLLYNNSIEYFDINLIGSFVLDQDIVSTTSPKYYEASLWTSVPTLAYSLKFKVVGTSSDTAPAPINPDNRDNGLIGNALRWAFVPNASFFRDYIDDIPALLNDKIPFAYFYQVKAIFDDISVTTSTLAITYNVDVGGMNMDLTTFDLGIPAVQTFAQGLRPFLIAILWILFALYLVFRVINFEL